MAQSTTAIVDGARWGVDAATIAVSVVSSGVLATGVAKDID